MVSYLKPAQSSRARYRARVTSAADKWVFLVFFLLGAASIVFLKIYGFPQLVVTFVPVALLLVYGLGSLLLRRFQLREDQTGDNCYYLGFLYTLVSLSFALYLFQTHESGTEAIITNFGIALVSTITGLFLRVFINQFRQDPVEIEREARLELGEAASRLRSELDTVVLELNSFRRSLQQSIEEAVNEANERSAKALEANTESVEKLSTVASQVIDALENLTTRIASIDVPTEIISEKLEPVLAALAAALEEMTERTKGDEKAVRQLARAVTRALQAAEAWDRRLEGLGQRTEDLAAFMNQIVGMPERVASAMQALTDGLAEQTTLFEEARKAASASAEESEQAFGRMQEAAAQTLQILQRHNEAMEQELAKARRDTARVEEALASMVTTLAERLDSDGDIRKRTERMASE